MVEEAFRFSLKLKEGNSPHVYVTQLQTIMENDTSLHPMMKQTLLLLKKTHTPYIILSNVGEALIDGNKLRHYYRSVNPKRDWVCTLWSDEEIKQHIENPAEHTKQILKFFESLGYELYNSEVCSLEYLQSIEELTRLQLESQIKQKKVN